VSQRPRNLATSVRQRLFNLAREKGEVFDLILTRYALERLLYRIGQSEWQKKFLLKGAMLFSLWYDVPYRPTRDLDLGYDSGNVVSLEQIFRSLCSLEVEEDGIIFLPESVRGAEIRDENEYQGVRIQLKANLAGARISLQVDVGFGDVVIPAPEKITYPTLLEFPAPKLMAYPRYTVVSEKFHVMVVLGIANSRMKDFYDLWVMARQFDFDGIILSRAIQATFKRRNTTLPVEIPLALTDAFSKDGFKIRQWDAFTRKNRLVANGETFSDITGLLREFIMPPVSAVARREKFNFIWPPSGPWKKHL